MMKKNEYRKMFMMINLGERISYLLFTLFVTMCTTMLIMVGCEMFTPQEWEEIVASGENPPIPQATEDTCEIVGVDTFAIYTGYLQMNAPLLFDSIRLERYAGYSFNEMIGFDGDFIDNASIRDIIVDKLDDEGESYDEVYVFERSDDEGFGLVIVVEGRQQFNGSIRLGVFSNNRSAVIPAIDPETGRYFKVEELPKRSGKYLRLFGNAGPGRFYMNQAGRGHWPEVISALNSFDGNIYGFNFFNTNYLDIWYDSLTTLILKDCKGYGFRADLRGMNQPDSITTLFEDREWNTVVND